MKTAAISMTPRPLPLFTAHACRILREHDQTRARSAPRLHLQRAGQGGVLARPQPLGLK